MTTAAAASSAVGVTTVADAAYNACDGGSSGQD